MAGADEDDCKSLVVDKMGHRLDAVLRYTVIPELDFSLVEYWDKRVFADNLDSSDSTT